MTVSKDIYSTDRLEAAVEGHAPIVRESPDDRATGAVLPVGLWEGFLQWLDDRRDRIEVITYADLPFEDDLDHERGYPAERSRWARQLKRGERDPQKAYVLIQHDVDDRPDRTLRALEAEDRLGIRSNVMVFNRRIRRKELRSNGRVVYRDYDLDIEALQALERRGFVIGYHANAYEQAGFDLAVAEQVFRDDVEALRRHFDIRFFCPHGGPRDAAGASNYVLDVPEALRGSLRWVLNRHTVHFDGVFSDGGMAGPDTSASRRSLCEFVKTWKPGGRYRILTHPQHYDTEPSPHRRLAPERWYTDILDGYASNSGYDAWADVELAAPLDRPRVAQLRQASREERPIFIGGDGRSGTTLVSVILDSHAQLAVGPELHFSSEKIPNLGPFVLECIAAIQAKDPRLKVLNDAEHAEFKRGVQFVRRVERAGFTIRDLEDAIRELMARAGHDVHTFVERTDLVQMLGRTAAQRDHADRFGFKIMKEIRNVGPYAECWPGAQFIHIIRDGRDVAASQMTEHASWGYEDIERAATGWVELIERSRENAVGHSLIEIRYEDLVEQPKATLQRLVSFLDVPWHRSLLRHHKMKHAFFRSSVRHPSREQTKKSINTSAVGRYRRDLTPEQIRRFEDIARPMLTELDYPVS